VKQTNIRRRRREKQNFKKTALSLTSDSCCYWCYCRLQQRSADRLLVKMTGRLDSGDGVTNVRRRAVYSVVMQRQLIPDPWPLVVTLLRRKLYLLAITVSLITWLHFIGMQTDELTLFAFSRIAFRFQRVTYILWLGMRDSRDVNKTLHDETETFETRDYIPTRQAQRVVMDMASYLFAKPT